MLDGMPDVDSAGNDETGRGIDALVFGRSSVVILCMFSGGINGAAGAQSARSRMARRSVTTIGFPPLPPR